MKQCIIISGVYSSGVGLSNVMVNLIRNLSAEFRIVCLGFDPEQKNNTVLHKQMNGCNIFIHPLGGTAHLFQLERPALESYLHEYQPVAVITLGPIMFNRYLLALLQSYRPQLKVISYLSVEGRLVDRNFLKYTSLMDYCVFYTASVQNDFRDLLQQNPNQDEEYPPVKSTYIGHGVDKRQFYPIPASNDFERRKQARAIIYKDYAVNEDSFVVLNMNRPSHRKKIDTTIAGFKLFAEGKENIYLHLHLGTTETDIRLKYQQLVNDAGLADKVILTPEPTASMVKSEDWLNTLYNACDVGISTSKGEGWGLGLFEHAATRAAIVAPGHTSFAENWKDAAILMPYAETQFVFYEYCDMFIISPDEVCQALKRLYADRALLATVADRCYQRVLEKRFDWESVAAAFQNVLEEIVGTTEKVVPADIPSLSIT